MHTLSSLSTFCPITYMLGERQLPRRGSRVELVLLTCLHVHFTHLKAKLSIQ